MKSITVTFVLGVVFSLMQYSPAEAGPYADELSKCLVESTSQRDRTELVRWFFASAALHPAVKPMSNVTEAQLDSANKSIADLMTRLLVDSCRLETEEALQYEGLSTIEVAFSVLGQVAGTELFSSPEVAEGLAGLESHFDREALAELKGFQQ